MHILFRFLVSPHKTLEDINSKPRWFVPFSVVVFGLLVITWLTSCWKNQSFYFQMDAVLIIFIAITLVLFLSWSFISVLLYLGTFLIETLSIIVYKSIFSVVSFCGVIFLVGEIINFLLIYTKLVNDSLFVLHNRFPVGLDVLAIGRSPHPALAILLYSINPFTVWYFTVLSIGLSTVTGLSKRKARIFSFLVWLFIVGFIIGVLLITGGTRISIKIGV